MPLLIEKTLESNSMIPFTIFFSKKDEDLVKDLVQDTISLEFGEFSSFRIKNTEIKNNIFLPKYYDPSINSILSELRKNCEIYSIDELVSLKIISINTGDEIGKQSYGTGEIPFVRTSDFSNWEIKLDTKQGVSEEIYQKYAKKQDVKAGDILLVRDGTYLVGTSCMITKSDEKMLYCGGLIKIRVLKKEYFDEFLLIGLLNSYIVKRQIRTKQFTRDVIDTLGRRFSEICIPIPKSIELRKAISEKIKQIIEGRIIARDTIQNLSIEISNIS